MEARCLEVECLEVERLELGCWEPRCVELERLAVRGLECPWADCCGAKPHAWRPGR